MKFRCLIAALALTAAATDSEAGPRRRAQPVYQSPAYQQPVYQYPSYPQPAVAPAVGYSPGYGAEVAPTVVPAGEYTAGYSPVVTAGAQFAAPAPAAFAAGAGDGLDEVNAKRMARGLRPYLRDERLTQAAHACAAHRAQYGLFGHTSNDFAFVPPGASAATAGCAAYPASYGWMSCCTYENYTFAGAAWVAGRDGKRYMHLFVR